jgi:hypothetical protein
MHLDDLKTSSVETRRLERRRSYPGTVPVVWTSADYELVWPREIFVHELEAIAAHPYRRMQPAALEWLLAEAFTSAEPIAAVGDLAVG